MPPLCEFSMQARHTVYVPRQYVAILEFVGKEMSGKDNIYTSENLTPKHRYSH